MPQQLGHSIKDAPHKAFRWSSKPSIDAVKLRWEMELLRRVKSAWAVGIERAREGVGGHPSDPDAIVVFCTENPWNVPPEEQPPQQLDGYPVRYFQIREQ